MESTFQDMVLMKKQVKSFGKSETVGVEIGVKKDTLE